LFFTASGSFSAHRSNTILYQRLISFFFSISFFFTFPKPLDFYLWPMDNEELRFKVVLLIPLFNPDEGWENDFLSGYRQFCEKWNYAVPVAICNDGSSRDLSFPLEFLKYQLGNQLHIIQHSVNKGKGAALKYAAGHLEADHYLFTDHDFPYTTDSMVNVLKSQLKNQGVTMGVRNEFYYKEMSFIRKFISKFLKTLNLFLLKLPSNDTQCGLKAFDKKSKKILLSCQVNRYLIDIEFLLAALKNGINISPVEVILRQEISFSTFNIKMILKEFYHFAALVWKYRIR